MDAILVSLIHALLQHGKCNAPRPGALSNSTPCGARTLARDDAHSHRGLHDFFRACPTRVGAVWLPAHPGTIELRISGADAGEAVDNDRHRC